MNLFSNTLLRAVLVLSSTSSMAQAEMVLSFTGTGQQESTRPLNIRINNLGNAVDGSNNPLLTTAGSLAGVTGSITMDVSVASHNDWSVDADDNLVIATLGDTIFARKLGWGVINGNIGVIQLLALTFDLTSVNLPANTGLRITKFTTDLPVQAQYIVDGESNTVLTEGTSFDVVTDLSAASTTVGFSNGPYILSTLTIDTYSTGGGQNTGGGGGPIDGPNTLAGSRPNLVFFLGDDQSIFDHAAYGNDVVPTPTTEAFARQSLVFDRAFTGQTICAPSRSILYTGMYPVKNGCFVNHKSLRPGVKTLPQYLKELNYTVILAGKSHVLPLSAFPWDFEWYPFKVDGKPRKAIPLGGIRNFLANPGPNPFCIIVASEYPHSPFYTTSPYNASSILLPPYLQDKDRESYALYYRNIVEKEGEFWNVLKAIDDNNLRQNTVVVYSDDHGHSGGKFWTYDRGTNVAFMVRWPQVITPGRTNALINFVDFVPTMIELAGGTPPSDIDGKSMLPIWTDPVAQIHEHVYGVAHRQGIGWNRGVYPQRSVHDGRYHYIYNFNSQERIDRGGIFNYFYWRGAAQGAYDEEELFDTLNDPYEFTNLADDASMAQIKEALKIQLFLWMDEQGDFLEEDKPTPFLAVDQQYRLDIEDPAKFYTLPAEQIGSLEGLYVDVHEISGPKLNATNM